MGQGVLVGHNAVAMLMHRTGLKGLPGNKRPPWRHEAPTAEDLVDRAFARTGPDELWVTDIERHEAPSDREEVQGLLHRAVAAAR